MPPSPFMASSSPGAVASMVPWAWGPLTAAAGRSMCLPCRSRHARSPAILFAVAQCMSLRHEVVRQLSNRLRKTMRSVGSKPDTAAFSDTSGVLKGVQAHFAGVLTFTVMFVDMLGVLKGVYAHPAGMTRLQLLSGSMGCVLSMCGDVTDIDESLFVMWQVACGGEHTMVIAQQGRVFVWGRGNTGQTGLGTTATINLPTRLEALNGQHITQVSVHPFPINYQECSQNAR